MVDLGSSWSRGTFSLTLCCLLPILVYGAVGQVCAFEHRSFNILRPRSITASPLLTRSVVLGDPSEYPAAQSNNEKPLNRTKIGGGGVEPQLYDENNNSVSNSRGVPASPCNRICRYNAAFYDGLVCIGCFREAYEIKSWNSMTNMQKSMTLLDAMDRCSDGDSKGYSFDGAVTLDELNRQFMYWSNLAQKS